MQTKNTSNRAVIVEIILFLTYAFFAINWIAVSTFTPQIMEQYNLKTFSSATFISNAITISKIIANLMAAKILIKLYPKKAVGFASFLIVLGSFFSLIAPNYLLFVLARFVMGFGGSLFIVYFGPIVLHYFDKQKRALVNGINSAAYNFGSVIAMLVISPLFSLTKSWKISVFIFCLCSLALFLAWLIFAQDFALQDEKDEKNSYNFKLALKEKFTYIYPFTYCGLLTLYFVLLTIFPISNTSLINPKILSALMASFGILGSIAGIIFTRKISSRLLILRYPSLMMSLFAFIMIMSKSSLISLLCASLVGFFMLFPMGAFMSIAQELKDMTSQKLTIIMGLFWSLSYSFETIFYYIIGLLIDYTNSFKAGLILAVILSLSFFIGSFLLPETGKNLNK